MDVHPVRPELHEFFARQGVPKAEAAVIEIKAAYAAINRTALKGMPAVERRQMTEQLRNTLGNLSQAVEKIPVAPKKQRPS